MGLAGREPMACMVWDLKFLEKQYVVMEPSRHAMATFTLDQARDRRAWAHF